MNYICLTVGVISYFTTTEISEGWDGIFSDERMNPGVYVWWLRAKVLSCRNEIDLFDERGCDDFEVIEVRVKIKV